MKTSSHFIIFICLLVFNLFFFYVNGEEMGIVEKAPFKMPEKVKFKSATDEEALVIKSNIGSGSTKLEINFGGIKAELKAKQDVASNSKKLKYKESDEEGDKSLFAYVKYGDNDGFKVFNASDKLLWKVKIESNKIKISNNEEGQNSLQVKYSNKKGKVKVKVYDAKEVNIASVKFNDGKLKVKKVLNEQEKDDLYSTKDINFWSYSIAVLAFDEIPAKERAIIATELLRKGK